MSRRQDRGAPLEESRCGAGLTVSSGHGSDLAEPRLGASSSVD